MNEMNEKMVITVRLAEGSNPDFAPEPELEKGIECHGYILITFDEAHELETATIGNLSVKNICDAVVANSTEGAISTLRQGFAVAEGFISAGKIHQDYLHDRAMKRMSRVLSGMDPDEMTEIQKIFADDGEERYPEDE